MEKKYYETIPFSQLNEDISDEGEQVEKLNHDIDLHYKLAKLPPRIKQMAGLILEGYSYKEIANKLNTTENAIEHKIRAYRNKLKEIGVF